MYQCVQDVFSVVVFTEKCVPLTVVINFLCGMCRAHTYKCSPLIVTIPGQGKRFSLSHGLSAHDLVGRFCLSLHYHQLDRLTIWGHNDSVNSHDNRFHFQFISVQSFLHSQFLLHTFSLLLLLILQLHFVFSVFIGVTFFGKFEIHVQVESYPFLLFLCDCS